MIRHPAFIAGLSKTIGIVVMVLEINLASTLFVFLIGYVVYNYDKYILPIAKWVSGNIKEIHAPAGIKLIMEKAEKNNIINSFQRKELEGLTAHDIWALESFKNKGTLGVASKVAAVSFLELGLIYKEESCYNLTDKGQQLLDIAESILEEYENNKGKK